LRKESGVVSQKIKSRAIGLIHLVRWNLESKEFELLNGVRLCKFQGSTVQKLHKQLIKKELIDEGQDYGYHTFIEIDNPIDRRHEGYQIGFFEQFDLVCSLMGITFGGYIDLVDILDLSDKRNKVFHIIPLLFYTETRPQIGWQVEKMPSNFEINPRMAKYLQNAWNSIWKGVKKQRFNRLFNAVRFYYLANTSIRDSETVLHLVIILETLFAPHSHSEITHQVSLNVSKFLQDNVEERKKLYKKLKDIYSDRSKIVHGGAPSDENKFSNHVDKAFNITAKALYKILSSPKLSTIFSDEKLRLKYIEDLNFQ